MARHVLPRGFPSLDRLTVQASGRAEGEGIVPGAWLWPILPQLKELDLDFDHFGSNAAEHLTLHAKRLRHLERLRLPARTPLKEAERMALEHKLENIEWSALSFSTPFEAESVA